ncbi:MAG: PfkB family carbohydrate kinase, partial [Bacteroidota bacterium]
LDELDRVKPLIMENIGFASLVRGSDDDFRHIFSAVDGRAAFAHVQQCGCPMLAYTRNSDGVEFLAPGCHLSLPVPPIDPVSTIGAGDAFNAGIIYAILLHTPLPQESSSLSGLPWQLILEAAIRFSEDVCMSLDNYISPEFAKTLNPSNPV